jgi:ATP-dependent Lon protease
VVRIEVLESSSEGESTQLTNLRERLTGAIQLSQNLGSPIPDHVMEFLEKIEEPETFLDISAFTLCKNVNEKQQLLETLDTCERFELFIELMHVENDRLRLLSKLKGNLSDEDIELN